MDLVDLIVAIVVVTILVTVIVGLATYVAYKFRLARQPGRSGADEGGTRYFFLHEPPAEETPEEGDAAEPDEASDRSAGDGADGAAVPAGDGR